MCGDNNVYVCVYGELTAEVLDPMQKTFMSVNTLTVSNTAVIL